MGGRLTTGPSSGSTATSHRASSATPSNNVNHPRTHSTGTTHSFSHQAGSNHPRQRSSSGHHHQNRHHHRPPSHTQHHGRQRATSTHLDPLPTTAFNLNLLRYVGLEHDSDDQSSEDDSPRARRRRVQQFLFTLRDVHCPACNKTIPSDSFEKHILQCLSKPRIDYNEDTLTEDKGECAICLDDLVTGQKIARLPCLCIYHKSCIDDWFRINRTCPEHPGD